MAWYVAHGVLHNANYTSKPKDSIGVGSFTWWSTVELPKIVTAIGDKAFYGCRYLERIDIPDTVKSIGKWAFAYTALTQIMIPKSVVSIGETAFEGCTNLKRILVAPDHPVFRVEDGMLLTREGVLILALPKEEIELPAWATGIAGGALAYHGQLLRIRIPEGVTHIGDGAFERCTALKEIELPDSLLSIGKEAFANCTQLRRVHFGRSLRSLSELAFVYCENIEQIELPDSLTEIPKEAFRHCVGLTRVRMGSAVERIGYGAFWYCYRIAHIDIPPSVVQIGDNAFAGCRGLTSIRLPDCTNDVGRYTFDCGEKLGSISLSGQAIKKIDKMIRRSIIEIRCTSSVDQVPADVRAKVCRCFAQDEDSYEPQVRAEYMAVIKKNVSQLMETAFSEPKLLRIMCREKMISAKSIDKFIEEAMRRENVELTALLLGYKETFRRKKSASADGLKLK